MLKACDHIDRKLLMAMIDLYDGGPVGLGAIAANISEDRRNYRRYVWNHIYYKLI